MSLIFAYIFYFIAASASPLQRRWLAKNKNTANSGQIAFSFHVTVITSVLSLLLLLVEPFSLQGNSLSLLFASLVCAVAGALCYVLSFTAQKHVEAGVGSVISNAYTPVTILLATVFFKRKININSNYRYYYLICRNLNRFKETQNG